MSPAVPSRSFVIFGGSLAGATAAATLRDEGYDGRLVLVGAEPLLPYERPVLSTEFLRGEHVRRSFGLISAQVAPDPGALADPDIDLRKLVPAMMSEGV